MLPLLFPECQLSLGSFDCIDCNEFFCTYNDEYYDIIVITIIIAATLLSAHFAREQILIFLFFPPI